MVPKYRAYFQPDKKIYEVQHLQWMLDKTLVASLIGEEFIFIATPEQFELMQWTGLVDCNDQEIYSGHIVKLNDLLFKVHIKFCQVYLTCITPNIFSWPSFYSHAKDCEVIGTIYTHPELLEGACCE